MKPVHVHSTVHSTVIYTLYDARFPSETTIWLHSASVRFSCPSSQSGLFPHVKTADVSRQPGQSGSSSPRALDRPAELHDGWALSISWLHLWPVPDYSWRLLYPLLSAALHAPLTLHSERAAGIKPSQHQKGKPQLAMRSGRGKNEAQRRIFSSLSYPPCSNDTVKKCFMTGYSLCHRRCANLHFLKHLTGLFKVEFIILRMRSDATYFPVDVSGAGSDV